MEALDQVLITALIPLLCRASTFFISLGWGAFSMYLNNPPLSSAGYYRWGGEALGAGLGLFALTGIIPFICFAIGRNCFAHMTK